METRTLTQKERLYVESRFALNQIVLSNFDFDLIVNNESFTYTEKTNKDLLESELFFGFDAIPRKVFILEVNNGLAYENAYTEVTGDDKNTVYNYELSDEQKQVLVMRLVERLKKSIDENYSVEMSEVVISDIRPTGVVIENVNL